MPIMINLSKELLRISPINPNKLEYSTIKGKIWVLRYVSNSIVGEFKDLLDTGKEIIAIKTVDLCFSINVGRSWLRRR